MNEEFRPVSNTAPEGFFGRLKLWLRFVFDFQIKTIYKNLKQFASEQHGTVLDVGCGDSPYKHLLPVDANYVGVDIQAQNYFGYSNRKIMQFDGYNIPLETSTVDALICTEVLEHVQYPQRLIKDFLRVMKPGAKGILTVPWSARNHYVPYDFYRYAYAILPELLQDFDNIKVITRGTDISVICSKIIVAYMRTFLPTRFIKILFLPISLLISPVLIASVLIGHLSLMFQFGSTDDPLGYTVFFEKPIDAKMEHDI
jgi:SAM-dependent methyltransferase